MNVKIGANAGRVRTTASRNYRVYSLDGTFIGASTSAGNKHLPVHAGGLSVYDCAGCCRG
ncbi:MAG: hypothetical protein GF398_16060 [Chitinivibrionales bacterium]|nr:hypothetical protein [Chitinivibrionales bacterium]